MLTASDLWLRHRRTDPWVLAGVGLTIRAGTVLGLSGPSGTGKSTLGATMAGLLAPQRGTVTVDGRRVDARQVRHGGRGRAACPVQLVTQRPELAMDPRWRIGRILAEAGPAPEGGEQDLVSPVWLDRFPHEISGGELQRVNLARALRARPAYIVADEISSSLDALTQAMLWDRLLTHVRRDGLGVLAISHDPHLLAALTDRSVTLEAGALVTAPRAAATA